MLSCASRPSSFESLAYMLHTHPVMASCSCSAERRPRNRHIERRTLESPTHADRLRHGEGQTDIQRKRGTQRKRERQRQKERERKRETCSRLRVSRGFQFSTAMPHLMPCYAVYILLFFLSLYIRVLLFDCHPSFSCSLACYLVPTAASFSPQPQLRFASTVTLRSRLSCTCFFLRRVWLLTPPSLRMGMTLLAGKAPVFAPTVSYSHPGSSCPLYLPSYNYLCHCPIRASPLYCLSVS